MDPLNQLASYEVLLAIGVTLCFIGIIMRGFARSARRAAALRKQHLLDERRPGDSRPPGEEGGGYDKRLPFAANAALVAGLLIIILSFFGK